MKLSVSLPDEDIAFLDQLRTEHHLPTRSAVLRLALDQLREQRLAAEYAAAADEWQDGDGADWDAVTGDGLVA